MRLTLYLFNFAIGLQVSYCLNSPFTCTLIAMDMYWECKP